MTSIIHIEFNTVLKIYCEAIDTIFSDFETKKSYKIGLREDGVMVWKEVEYNNMVGSLNKNIDPIGIPFIPGHCDKYELKVNNDPKLPLVMKLK